MDKEKVFSKKNRIGRFRKKNFLKVCIALATVLGIGVSAYASQQMQANNVEAADAKTYPLKWKLVYKSGNVGVAVTEQPITTSAWNTNCYNNSNCNVSPWTDSSTGTKYINAYFGGELAKKMSDDILPTFSDSLLNVNASYMDSIGQQILANSNNAYLKNTTTMKDIYNSRMYIMPIGTQGAEAAGGATTEMAYKNVDGTTPYTYPSFWINKAQVVANNGNDYTNLASNAWNWLSSPEV